MTPYNRRDASGEICELWAIVHVILASAIVEAGQSGHGSFGRRFARECQSPKAVPLLATCTNYGHGQRAIQQIIRECPVGNVDLAFTDLAVKVLARCMDQIAF